MYRPRSDGVFPRIRRMLMLVLLCAHPELRRPEASRVANRRELVYLEGPLPPHLPLTLDDDASPHEGMYLAVVRLLPCRLEDVRIPLSLTQTSGVERSFFVRRRGVRMHFLVDPPDPRPPLDGDVGRLEAVVLDQNRPGWMFLCLGRGMFVRPGDGHDEQRAHHDQRRHRRQQDDAPHKRNLLLLLTPHSGDSYTTVVRTGGQRNP